MIGAGVCRGGRIDFAIGIGPIGRAPPLDYLMGVLRGAGYPIRIRRRGGGAGGGYALRATTARYRAVHASTATGRGDASRV